MSNKEINVTILESQKVPLQHVLGEKVASVLQKLSEKNGVKIITNAKINNVSNEEGKQSVNIEGSSLPTDVLIVATGVQPAADFAKGL